MKSDLMNNLARGTIFTQSSNIFKIHHPLSLHGIFREYFGIVNLKKITYVNSDFKCSNVKRVADLSPKILDTWFVRTIFLWDDLRRMVHSSDVILQVTEFTQESYTWSNPYTLFDC